MFQGPRGEMPGVRWEKPRPAQQILIAYLFDFDRLAKR